MAFVPPWLSFGPLDFVHAAAQGADIGLRRSQIDTGANEAADRLQLAYAQLAGEQSRASMSESGANARAAMARAAEEERSQASDRLKEIIHQSQIDEFKQRLGVQQGGLDLNRDKANNLLDYRNARLGQFESGLDETARHHGQTESISADKASAMLKRGEAMPITFPEFPGVTFIKQPSGTILKVESALRSPTISIDSTGAFKGASGPMGNPQMRAIMGTNALPGAVDSPAGGTGWEPPPGLPMPAAASLLQPQASPLFNPSQPAQPRKFNDGNKTWIYTGTEDDPTKDTNPDNWKPE